jgi:hypothetical protein
MGGFRALLTRTARYDRRAMKHLCNVDSLKVVCAKTSQTIHLGALFDVPSGTDWENANLDGVAFEARHL